MTETTPVGRLEHILATRRRLPPPARRRQLREQCGLSAAELAACMGVSRQAVAQWERGVRTPQGENLDTYVAMLDRLEAAAGERSA